MKKIMGTVLICFISCMAFAQQEIKIEDVAKHEGDSVTICTKIFGAKYFEGSGKAPTLLNAGAKYPESPLTIVIYGEDRSAFKNKPEEYYPEKNICVTGKVSMFRGKPQIVITKEEQIKVKE